MVAGVAGGLARYFGVDPTLVRLAFVALTLAGGGVGLLAYVVLAVLMPLEPESEARMAAEAGRRAEAPEYIRHPTPEEETREEVQEARVPESPWRP